MGQSVVLPNEKATPEARAKFYASMGRTDKPEDYVLDKIELPKGLTADEGMEKDFLNLAHAKGLNTETVNGIRAWYMETMGKQIMQAQKVVKTTQAEAVAAMREAFGADYDASQAYMERGFQKLATPELSDLFKSTGLGNHPHFIKMFVDMGRLITEHPVVDGSRGEHLEQAAVGNRTDKQIADLIYPPKE